MTDARRFVPNQFPPLSAPTLYFRWVEGWGFEGHARYDGRGILLTVIPSVFVLRSG